MFTQKRPERLVIGKVLDERAARKPTSGGSSETEKKDPTVLPAAFPAIAGAAYAGLSARRPAWRRSGITSALNRSIPSV
jgi:hypothetical protein